MYLMPGTSTMHMCYALNNNWNSCYTHTQPFELNEWYNIRVAQADFQIIRLSFKLVFGRSKTTGYKLQLPVFSI